MAPIRQTKGRLCAGLVVPRDRLLKNVCAGALLFICGG
jgi:hypothetical protein